MQSPGQTSNSNETRKAHAIFGLAKEVFWDSMLIPRNLSTFRQFESSYPMLWPTECLFDGLRAIRVVPKSQ
jgi:hypothetical protein